MNDKVECRGRRVTFISQIEKLPNGREVRIDRVVFPNAVTILPVSREDCSIYLIRQYRPAIGKWLLEAPAGVIDEGESPIETAKRELAEETGMKAKELVKVAEGYMSPGYSTEYMYLYLAIDPEKGQSSPEHYEVIEGLVKLQLDEALEKIKNAEITDLKTILAIMAAKDYCRDND
ncbi:MAG: NUDIX hydrolase [Crenarchaeota archaeon]|nr:NUDIX hydrolase [Thermoproteota archaeon]